MQILKKYLIPVLLTPIVCSVMMLCLKFLFQVGRYGGIFWRGLYELVLKSV